MNQRKKLSELLKKPGILETVGIGDAGQAKLVEGAGFPIIYMAGSLVSYTYGMMDIGLLTLNEMLERAKSIARVINVPLIADADDGYGGPLQIMRTIREYEQVGVAGLHLEDMKTKKRGELFPLEEMKDRIRAAAEAKTDPDFCLVARTDAMTRQVTGFPDAAAREKESLKRSIEYAEAGADMIFVQNPSSTEQLARFCREIPKPVMVTMGNHAYNASGKELEDAGVKFVVYPSVLFINLLPHARDVLASVKESRKATHSPEGKKENERVRELFGQSELKRVLTAYEK